MVTFKEYVNELNNNEYVALDIDNTESLYQIAMRAKTPEDLKKVMLKMKAKFDDANNIDFAKVDWDIVYSDINESSEEGFISLIEKNII